MTCTQCGEEMRLIPAGISKKSGKPYNAFFSCKNNHTKPAETSPEAPKSSTSSVPIEYDTKTLQDRVTALEERIEAMSKWAAGIENKIKAHDALLIDLRGETAVELHSSFEQHAGIDNMDLEPKKFDFKKAKDLLQDPDNIPIVIETPENLVDKNF